MWREEAVFGGNLRTSVAQQQVHGNVGVLKTNGFKILVEELDFQSRVISILEVDKLIFSGTNIHRCSCQLVCVQEGVEYLVRVLEVIINQGTRDQDTTGGVDLRHIGRQ